MSLYQSYSFTLLTIVLLPIFSCQQQAPSTVQTKIPTRVITLTPSNTELVAAIAGVEVLVGRDRFSTEPPAVKSIPVVGDFFRPNIEHVVRIAPDIVILDQAQQRAKQQLHHVGISTLMLPMNQVKDLRNNLRILGNLFHKKTQATKLIATIDHAIEQAQVSVVQQQKLRVLVVVDRAELRTIVAAGANTYLDELIQLAGAQNILPAHLTAYPRIALETILHYKPDVILDMHHDEHATNTLAIWDQLKTLTQTPWPFRVYALNPDLFAHLGPKFPKALAHITKLLQVSPVTDKFIPPVHSVIPYDSTSRSNLMPSLHNQ